MKRDTKIEPKVLDLWNTKDSDFLGRVGEAVAWKYLWRQFIITWPFWHVVQTDLFRKDLTSEQQNYLKGFRGGNKPARAWDLAGLHHGSGCLVEVKTTRSDRYRYDSRKFPETVQRLEAKSLEFKLLLVVVRLVDNWKFAIASRELWWFT